MSWVSEVCWYPIIYLFRKMHVYITVNYDVRFINREWHLKFSKHFPINGPRQITHALANTWLFRARNLKVAFWFEILQYIHEQHLLPVIFHDFSHESMNWGHAQVSVVSNRFQLKSTETKINTDKCDSLLNGILKTGNHSVKNVTINIWMFKPVFWYRDLYRESSLQLFKSMKTFIVL